MQVAIEDINASELVGKTIGKIIDNGVDITPPYSLPFDFKISAIRKKTTKFYDQPFNEGNVIGEMKYVVLYNMTGASLNIEEKPGVVLEVI